MNPDSEDAPWQYRWLMPQFLPQTICHNNKMNECVLRQ